MKEKICRNFFFIFVRKCYVRKFTGIQIKSLKPSVEIAITIFPFDLFASGTFFEKN